jgi:phosphatidyl-myo-inositol alpha-mannosyltransferase
VRIAIVSPYDLDVVGGVQAHVHALAAALGRTGDETFVLGPGRRDRTSSDGSWQPATGGEPATGPTTLRVGRSIAVPANGSRAPLALDPRSVMRLRRLLRDVRPDIVHVHEPLVPLLGPAAVRALDVPRVLTFHASAEGGALPRMYRAVRGPARRLVATADALTAVSPVAAAFHARMLGIDVARLEVVPNGVDVARFASAAGEVSAAAVQRRAASGTTLGPVIVFLGRLEHRKGADVAVRAFLRLARERPDVRMRVLGDGPLAPTLERLRTSAPPDVAARLDLFGRADPRELPGLLAAADVAVLPSRGGESFGIVLLEAMAADVPIVATDIPGYRAVARHDREALLVPPEDETALAAAVARLIDEPVLAARLRSAGRERADEHDWLVVAERMRGVYRRAVEAPQGGPLGR